MLYICSHGGNWSVCVCHGRMLRKALSGLWLGPTLDADGWLTRKSWLVVGSETVHCALTTHHQSGSWGLICAMSCVQMVQLCYVLQAMTILHMLHLCLILVCKACAVG